MMLYAYPFPARDEPGAWLVVVPLWVSLRQKVQGPLNVLLRLS